MTRAQSSTATVAIPRMSNNQARGELHWHWQWTFRSSPEQLWPLVSNTERFNKDAAVPPITDLTRGTEIPNGKRLLKMHRLSLGPIKLVPITWHEEPFQWVEPRSFGVMRRYTGGPLDYMRVYAELQPTADGGTLFTYDTWIRPRGPLGWLAAQLQLSIISRVEFDRAFRHYDAIAAARADLALELGRVRLAPGAESRLATMRDGLVRRLGDPAYAPIVDRLIELVRRGDDITLGQMRPYALADSWGFPRRAVLETCLYAVRVGLLSFRWEVLCPLCRGTKDRADHLDELRENVHCDVCHVDFDVNFDQAVEITFFPSPAIRPVESLPYCVGGPQMTPHIVTQQLLEPGAAWEGDLHLETGRYRLRLIDVPGGQYLRAEPGGTPALSVRSAAGWTNEEMLIDPLARLMLVNDDGAERLFILERLRWSDQAVTAAEVTTLQLFRDLFSSEALRPDARISVGALTIVFTDLKGSSRLYREVGDAPAFGLVMNHFDVLRTAIAAENGAIVKTLGDAVMAVFLRPVNALRAILWAQEQLAAAPTPMVLKAGVHTGHSIAVTLNERLDYFGTNINQAARLADLSQGGDIVISDMVYDDPEVRELLDGRNLLLDCEGFLTPLRGFGDERFPLYRVTLRTLHV